MASLTKHGYLEELFDIRDKLKDFLELAQKGRWTYYKDVALKLRVLFCHKSRTKPLLTTLEELLGFEVVVAIRYTMQERVDLGHVPARLTEGLVFEQINSVVTWFEGGDAIVGLQQALDRKEILLGTERHSYREVIEVAADKRGAHVDSTIPDRDFVLHDESLLIGGLPVAQRALFDTARAAVTLIDRIEACVKRGQTFPYLRTRKAKAS